MGNEEIKFQFERSLYFTLLLSVLIFIPTFLFYKEKPLTPPSISENEDIKVKKSFKNEVIALLRDSNFVWVSIATSSMISYTYVCPTILEEMTSIYGFNE